MRAQIILIEQNRRAIRVFKSLLRLKSIAKDVTVYDPVPEIAQQLIDIGFQEKLIILFHKFNLYMIFGVDQIGLFLFPCLSAVKVSVAVRPDG